jgi:hypothetical protein
MDNKPKIMEWLAAQADVANKVLQKNKDSEDREKRGEGRSPRFLRRGELHEETPGTAQGSDSLSA